MRLPSMLTNDKKGIVRKTYKKNEGLTYEVKPFIAEIQENYDYRKVIELIE